MREGLGQDITLVELVSIEVVMDEQITSVSTLLSQGNQTATSLEARQDDVECQLGKMYLNAKESERMTATNFVVSTLNASCATEQSKTRTTRRRCQEQILSHGRSTRETLKGFISTCSWPGPSRVCSKSCLSDWWR